MNITKKLAVGILAGATMLATCAFAYADKRIALVIGNSTYTKVPALANPGNDAKAMAASLRRLGFEVILGINLDIDGMDDVIEKFQDKLVGADVATLFYAGHGVQVNGENYLIPIHGTITKRQDLRRKVISMNDILSTMDDVPLKIALLDACRNNPLPANFKGGTRGLSMDQGLADLKATEGSMIVYATAPGQVAQDGSGRHSPFTTALLKHMETPNLEIQSMISRVREDVHKSTGKKQVPWTSTSILGEYYLNGSAAVAKNGTATPVQIQATRVESASEKELWAAVIDSTDPEDFDLYLNEYPLGHHVAIARLKILRLRKAAAKQDGIVVAALNTQQQTPIGNTAKSTQRAIGVVAVGPTAIASVAASQPQVIRADPRVGELDAGFSRSEFKAIQGRLTSIGHSTRGVDGSLGRNSRRAISSWQLTVGHVETGYMDRGQYNKLIVHSGAAYGPWLERRRAARVVVHTAPKKTWTKKRRTTTRKSHSSNNNNNNNNAAGAFIAGAVIGGIIGAAISK